MLEPVLPEALATVVGAIPAAPVVGVMTFGLIMAIVGHIAKNNALAATGIAVLFLATAAMVLLAYLDFQQGGSFDPRPKDPKLPPQVYE